MDSLDSLHTNIIDKDNHSLSLLTVEMTGSCFFSSDMDHKFIKIEEW